ncbi:cell division protein FtsX [Novosphingobium lentum]|uniref:cell division protein FtsX n=1 Tax=Novosphingobium lentum TaxID=145287 RepID=UPI000B0070CC|nr:cell division protein [Novosphingobium lentum]
MNAPPIPGAPAAERTAGEAGVGGGLAGVRASLAEQWRERTGGADARMLPQARLSGPMPWVMAIMIALTVIAAASGLALRNTAHAASADLAGGVTVQILSAAPADRARQVAAALTALRTAPGVAQAAAVPQDQLNALIEPWLGTRPGDDLEALPIPALIDVRLSAGAGAQQIAQLRRLLAPVAPSARVDAQASWLSPVFGAIGALQVLAATLIALLAAATAAAVLLAVRNALGSNRVTIEIIHMLGGTDSQIARIFQRGVAADAAAGGIVGLGLGIVAIALLRRSFVALESGMVAGGGLGWIDWLLILLVPLGGLALAVLTARLTVLRALRRML